MPFPSVRRAIFAALCGLALCGSGTRAENPSPTDPTVPGPEHKLLNSLSGDWNVLVRYVIVGKEHDGKSSCQVQPVLDGRFLRMDYASRFGGKPFAVVQYLGFDRLKGKFVELHMNSMDTGVMCNEGTASRDGKTITCSGPRIDPETHQQGKIRTVTTLMDPDHFTTEWYITNAAGKESKGVTLTHIRKRPA